MEFHSNSGLRVHYAVRTLSTGLMMAGLLAILIYAWTRIDENLYQATQRLYLPAVPPAAPAAAGSYSKPTAPEVIPNDARAITVPRIEKVLRILRSPFLGALTSPDPKVVGRLVIPRLDVDAIIRQGTDELTLRRALGHIPETALPGRKGNFVVTGHRDTFFRPLRHIRKDDEILAITSDEIHTYRVYQVSVVNPDYVHVLRPTSEPECTLVTCFPFDYVGSAPRRFIVHARLHDVHANGSRSR
jgi:LPXTG-site transpeptidase (sortase) family protein